MAMERGEEHQRERDAHHRDGDVDVEDDAPVHVLDEVSAERRAERGGDDHADPVHAHRRAHLVLGDDAVDHRQRDGGQQRAGYRLQHAEADEAGQAPRQPAQRRRDREPRQAEHVQAGESDAIAEPRRGRHDDAEHQAVCGADPRDVGRAAAELGLDRRYGDVDDGRVEHRHEHADDEHQKRHDPVLDRVGVGWRSGGGLALRDRGRRHDRWILAVTFMPGTRSRPERSSIAILTGMTCVTFWKLPVVLDWPNRENTPAAPVLISTTRPVRGVPEKASTAMSTTWPTLTSLIFVSSTRAVTKTALGSYAMASCDPAVTNAPLTPLFTAMIPPDGARTDTCGCM